MPTAPLISRRLTSAAFSRDGGEEKWITLNGVHIQIGKGGKIVAGPAHLVGKPVSHLAEHQKGDQVTHRQHGPATVTKVSHIGDGQFAYNVKTAAGKEDLAFGPELSRGGGEQDPAPTPTAKSAPAATAAKPGSLSAAPLPEFAGRVQRIADRQSVKFGDKAYISHVMRDAIAEDPSLTEAAFKNKLKAAATAGHVELSRADLSGLHDPPTVAASYVNREPGMDATAMGIGGNHGLPVGTSAHMIRTGIRRHAMSRTDAEPLDVLTFDRPAAVVNIAGDAREVPALGDNRPAVTPDGKPIRYYRKELLRVGSAAHTPEGQIRFTPEALDAIARNTKRWMKDGGKPHVPLGHADADKSNLGWITDVGFDGEKLWADHQMIGEDAILAAARHDSSVMLRWNFKHGDKTYPIVLEHNALTAAPKVPGLGEFVALSRGGQTEDVPVYSLTFDRGDAGGHWITLEGRHILIPDTAGIVPARVKAEPGALKRFTRANLEKAITDHHREKSGESGEYTTGMERELTEAAGDAEDAFVFHKKLPTEIKDAVGENPALRRVFTTTDDAKKAHGSDAYSALGDRYIDIAEARAGSPLRQAKAFARSSGDPEAAFVAHVHDNLPESAASLKGKASKLRASVPKNLDRAEKLEEQAKTAKPADAAKLRQEAKGLRRDAADAPARAAEHDKAAETAGFEPVKAGGLRVGDEFTIGGKAHRVAEDEHGFRVLRSHEYGKGDIPLDAVSHVPVDKNSFRRSKVSRRLVAAASDGIPFSRRLMAFGREDFTEGHFREIDGHTVFLAGPDLATGHLWGGTRGGRTAKILTRGGTKTVTVAPHGEGHRVTESGPGAGQHTHADHPTAAAAVADARSRVAGAEANAKAKGEHVATMEKVPGERPGGRYSVRHVVGENGQAAAYLIDHKSGDVMRPAGSIVRHYESAADAHAVADRMNAREAGAGVPGVSKRLTQAAETPTTGNPTVDTARQFGLFAKDKSGAPAEIGEKPGQANLFNASKYDKGPPPKAAPAPKDEPGQMVMPATASTTPAVSARLQAAAVTPGEPAKSAGHVGFYRDNINRPRELYKDSTGNLHSASTDNPVDPSTGRRPGRHEAGPEGADRAAAHLMSGAKVIQRQGGASAFSPRARADVRENARAVLAGNAAPAAPAVSKRLEAAAVKGENGGMETPKEGPRRSETTFETGDPKVPQIKLSIAKATAGEAGEVRAARVDAKGVHNYNYYKKLPTMAEARAHYEELKVKYERDAKAAGKFKGMSEAHG